MDGTLTPAYGRDYKSAKLAVADFVAGKDFILNTPRGTTYCSIRDFKYGGIIKIRYNKKTKVTFHTMEA